MRRNLEPSPKRLVSRTFRCSARAAGLGVLLAVGACGWAGTLAQGDAGPDAAPPLGIEPTMRDPFGYTGRPVDSSPTTSELERDRGLPREGDPIPGDEDGAGGGADLLAVPPLPSGMPEGTAVE